MAHLDPAFPQRPRRLFLLGRGDQAEPSHLVIGAEVVDER